MIYLNAVLEICVMLEKLLLFFRDNGQTFLFLGFEVGFVGGIEGKISEAMFGEGALLCNFAS